MYHVLIISHQSIPILVNKYHDPLEAALGELPGGVGSTLEKGLQLCRRHPLVGVRPGGLRVGFNRAVDNDSERLCFIPIFFDDTVIPFFSCVVSVLSVIPGGLF